MKKFFLMSVAVSVLFCGSEVCAAVDGDSDKAFAKGLETICEDAAKAHVYFLASDELQGREAGSDGDRVAMQYIVANLRMSGVKPLDGNYVHPSEAVRRARVRNARFQTSPDSVDVIKADGACQLLPLNNVLGFVEGRNKDEYVIIGAHYDHEGMDELLCGDRIYNGADDNASGVSALLQIAKAFRESGVQPERNVIFAFWDGEEKGLLGSSAFTYRFKDMDKVKGYINFDMIGRTTYNKPETHVVFFYSAACPDFKDWADSSVKELRLNLVPDTRATDKTLGGSDNISFQRFDVPIMWYHTDGHEDYNRPTDTADKINYGKLVDITRSAYYCLWRLANEKF